jgi:tripartite-type tricarboxylate transporter receptor subunit TctC
MMKKHFLAHGLAVAISTLYVALAQAQSFPSKPITLVVPFAPGASADGIARVIARDVAATLGQPVVVDNRPGGGGATGLLAVARAPADGYTIGLGATGAIAVNPHLPDAAPLKPQSDLKPVAKLADIPLVFVAGKGAGFQTLGQFIDKSADDKEGVSYGNSGQYTSQHLAGELLANLTKTKMVSVPYRGSGPAITDLLGGQLPVAMVDLTSAYPHVKAGALVALGVTSPARTTVAPEIPTLAEAGVKGYSAVAWMGLFAPASTPDAVMKQLSEAVKTAIAKPEVKAQILSLAAEPSYLDSAAFAKFINGESKKWADVIRSIPKPAK